MSFTGIVWRVLCGVVLWPLLASAPALASTLEGDQLLTTVVVQALASPRPVAGADGHTHLAYELSFVNETRLLAHLDEIAVLDNSSGAILADWKGGELASIFRVNGSENSITLAASHSGYAFLDVALPSTMPMPTALRHRISMTRLMHTSGGGDHDGSPLDPKLNLPSSVTFEGVVTPIDRGKAIVISPPLRGPDWVAFNGCCDTITSHRGAVMAFNGKASIAERFAIDFVQVSTDSRLFVGPGDMISSYPYFGVPVYAVANGLVVELSDGAPEQVPGASPAGVTVDSAAGNHIVIDMGGGNFALYAHLKTGTVAVKVGDHLKSGEVIAHLGNTGNSDAPHLHFHVMDGPSPLMSSGLPYVIDAFKSEGRFESDDDFFAKGSPGKIDHGWFPGAHRFELPLNNELVSFPTNP
jgi:hypothetical protein